MKISTHMLKTLMHEVPNNLKELTNGYITEIESYESLVVATGLVTGHVLTCEDHPNSDHLHVTTVDLGNGLVEQIVCGAANVAAGQYVIVATPGAVLPGNFEIKRSKIRGVESNGMICSLRELGIEDKYVEDQYKDGIFYYGAPVPLGQDPLPFLNLNQDSMELSLTPNRADLLSVLGFAYDLSAVLNKKLVYHEETPFESEQLNPVVVQNETQGCYRYFARTLNHIQVKSSPEWLRADLIASGIRPINNVVDVTNYVMLQLGVPLHAFDRQKFETNKVVIRDAKAGEEVITLDGIKRILTAKDIVITNGLYPVALAGVMGLENTMVDNETTSIILEAASFDPKRIGETSKRLDLRSDSSLRFERGIDETRVRMAINKAASMLYELANAEVTKEIANTGIPYPKPVKIELHVEKVNKHLGIQLSKEQLRDILKRLNIIPVSEDIYLVPSYRNDLRIEADLIEEVARIYGLNNIPMTLPKTNQLGHYSKRQTQVLKMRRLLRHQGFNEVLNYSLLKTSEVNLFTLPSEDIISVLHPLSEDKKSLRHSLINGLVENAKYHTSRQINDLKFFEVGKVYYSHEEPIHMAGLLMGAYQQIAWSKQGVESSFYVLKGIVDAILRHFDLVATYEKQTQIEGFHPGVCANILIQNQVVGVIGKLHPNLELDAYTFELSLEKIMTLIEPQPKFEVISKYPNITRDLAFVVDQQIEVGKITKLIEQTARKFLVDLKLFDVYRDDRLGESKQSLAYNLTFNSKDKTLEASDVDKLMKSIINRLQFEFKAELRS